MEMSVFNIGLQFSQEPSGRYYSDTNKRSGEAFREEFLRKELEALQPDEKITFIMDDGVEGYGSSFLTEGFAGIVKYGYMQASEFKRKIEFQYSDSDFKFYADKIIQYISEAQFNSKKYVPTKPKTK